MADDNLQYKLAQAKQAMAGNREEQSRRLLAEELVRRRNDVLTTTPEKQSSNAPVILSPEEVVKRREQAKRAMESFEQKKRREEREKSETEAKTLAQKIQEMKEARLEFERKHSSSEERQKLKVEEDKRRTEEAYQRKVIETKEEISTITNTPTPDIDTYRTLRTDVNEQVSMGGLTMSKIALEEEARKRLATLPRETKKTKMGLAVVISSISLIVIGLGALGLSIVLTKPTVSQIKPLVINSIIFADDHQELAVDTKTPVELQNIIKAKAGQIYPTTKVIDIYPTKIITTDNGSSKVLLSGEETLAAFNITLPIGFNHFLLPTFMMGIVTEPNTSSSSPFFVFKTRSFEDTLDALLREENLIIGNTLGSVIDTDTKSSIQTGTFKDVVINNTNARILRDSSGQTIAIYGFFDRATLVITTNSDIFKKLLTAYQTPRPTIQ